MAVTSIFINAIIDKTTGRIVFYQLPPNNLPLPMFPVDCIRFSGAVTIDPAAGLSPDTSFNFKLDTATNSVAAVAQDTEAVMTALTLRNRKYSTYIVLMTKVVSMRRATQSAIPGQQETYLRKEAQARAFRQSGYSQPAKFPMIQDYAQAVGVSPQVAADNILRKARQTNAVLRTAERARMVYGKAIFQAASFADLAQVASNITAI